MVATSAILAFTWKAYTAYRTLKALISWRTASPLAKVCIILRLVTMSPPLA